MQIIFLPQKINLLLLLKKMSAFAMLMIKVDGISGLEAMHNKGGQRYLSATA
jgi:hypothetical protein